MNSVVAITATYKRPAELSRLLVSLEKSLESVRAVIVVDNANDPDTQKVAVESGLEVQYLVPGKNLGCGGGLALAEETALKVYRDTITHVWILDDDAVVAPEALGNMLSAMRSEGAELAHALILDENGKIGWRPGLLDSAKLAVLREEVTPEEFEARCGTAPVPLNWAQGISLLVTRQVLEKIGFHRRDYLIRGEDMEFSLRATQCCRGIYVPRARVEHLTPPPLGHVSPQGEYRKHCALLQNLTYTAIWLPHGRPLRKWIPNIWGRFFWTWGIRPSVLADAVRMFIRGGVLKRPAGAGTGELP